MFRATTCSAHGTRVRVRENELSAHHTNVAFAIEIKKLGTRSPVDDGCHAFVALTLGAVLLLSTKYAYFTC